MRLDEAALLEQGDIKTERNIKYFDLTEALVKNRNSAGKIPIQIASLTTQNYLNNLTDDRLFDFP